MSQTQRTYQKFYRSCLTSLEKDFLENKSDQQIWQKFTSSLYGQFKLQITFDSRFSDIFRDYFREVLDTHAGSELLTPKLSWLERLNSLAYSHRFISYRDYLKIHDQVKAINACPSTAWLSQLDYIRSASSLDEFRGDFLCRFCSVSDEEAETMIEEIDTDSGESLARLKEEYVAFFQKCLLPSINVKVASFVESEWSKWENKSEMLPKSLIAALEKQLRAVDMGGSSNEVEINRALVEIAQNNLYQNDREVQQRLDNEVELIQKALDKFSGLNVIKDKELVLHLGKFGSLVSGFASTDADLDLTVLTSSYVKEDQFLKLLQEFLKKEYQEGDRRSPGRRVVPELILTAKTPLIAISIMERNRQDIKIDLIVNNVLGVINSKFLRVYASVNWVRNLGILAKLWGKSVEMIDKRNLSSYSIILMLIHYLIKSKTVKPIMDARNRSNDAPYFKFKRIKLGEVEQFPVYYSFKTNKEDVSTLERVNYCKILQGFLRYYAYDIWKDPENDRIITVDQSIDKPVERDYVLTIKDPFDDPHNPGRLRIESKDFLVQKFSEAYNTLKNCKDGKMTSEMRKEKIGNLFADAQ